MNIKLFVWLTIVSEMLLRFQKWRIKNLRVKDLCFKLSNYFK